MATRPARFSNLRRLWRDSGPIVSYGVAILAFAICGLIFFENLRIIREGERSVSHTHEVQTNIRQIQLLLRSAESGERGYLLTGEPAYLKPYHAALSQLESSFRDGRRLVADNQTQLNRLWGVQELTDQRLKVLDEKIQAYVAGRKDDVLARMRSAEGKQLMEQISSKLDQMIDSENTLLLQRAEQSEEAYRRAIASGWLAGFVGLSLVLASLLFVTRELQRRSIAETELRRQSGQIRMLSEVAARIASVRDASSVVGAAPHEIRQLIPCRLAILQVSTPERQVSVSGALGEAAQLDATAIQRLLELDDSGSEVLMLTGDEVKERFPRILDAAGVFDANRPPNLLRVSLYGRQRQRIGVLQLVEKLDDEFSSHDRVIAMQFGYSLGIAIQNALLIEQMHFNDQRKDEFLAMLGHELRNPLAGIVTGVEALQQGQVPNTALASAVGTPGESQELTAVISRQAAHMSRLVDDLLDVSRIASGKISLRREPVDLRKLASEVVRDFAAATGRESELHLEDHTPRDQPLLVSADPTRLAQCLVNLLNNAHKFSQTSAAIIVRLRTPASGASTVCIDVQDHGVGLTRENLSAVFEVFRQVNPDVDRSAGGLGLGLALVKGLVSLHGGNVVAASEGLGRGSTFTVTLPLLDEAAAIRPSGAEPAPPAQLAPTTVLLIDDRRDSLLPLRVLLTRDGHTVYEAGTGAAGLARAREQHPEVILCDIGLPGGMTGYDVARAIRNDDVLKGIYLVAVSGYGQRQDIRDAAQAGFDFHTTKPVGHAELRRLLNERPRFDPAIWDID